MQANGIELVIILKNIKINGGKMSWKTVLEKKFNQEELRTTTNEGFQGVKLNVSTGKLAKKDCRIKLQVYW